MDIRSTEHLKRILKKSLTELTDLDKRYLRARQTFLTPEQKINYMDILGIRGTEQPKEIEKTYAEYMNEAKTLGYQGKKIKLVDLKQYIVEHTK